MARWSLFEKREVESLSRVLVARTLDGYKIRAKLAVNFTRLMSEAETEALAQSYAEAFRALIESELSEGRLPFDEVMLHQLLTERVQAFPPHRVRLSAAHVVAAGSASSGSMPAVRPSPSISAARSASMPATRPAPSVPGPSAASVQARRYSASLPASHAPPASAPSKLSSAPANRTVSGFVPSSASAAKEPLRPSGFMRAVAAVQTVTSVPALGSELGQAVRGAAASLLATALRENESQLPDALAFFEGTLDPALSRALVQEACLSAAYVLYRALVQAGIVDKHAISLVQAATVAALRGGELPVADMSRYFATDMPGEEFHKSFCRLLGISGADDAESAVVHSVNSLCQDALVCAATLKTRLRAVG